MAVSALPAPVSPVWVSSHELGAIWLWARWWALAACMPWPWSLQLWLQGLARCETASTLANGCAGHWGPRMTVAFCRVWSTVVVLMPSPVAVLVLTCCRSVAGQLQDCQYML